MTDWQPIQTLLDDPTSYPMLVYDEGVIMYGDGNGEIILGRDMRFGKISEKSKGKDELDWFTNCYLYNDKALVFEDAVNYRDELRKPTHWMEWPDKPKEKDG